MRWFVSTLAAVVLCSLSAEAMTKDEYKALLRKKTPRAVCDMTMFGLCFVEEDDACVAKAREEMDACIKANEKLIPGKFTLMTLVPITRKIDACLANHLRRKLHLRKNASATCRKFQQTVQR